MADGTSIEWTDATWNPIGGCSIKSPGCKPCYAQKLAGTRLKNHPLYAGTTTPTKDGKPVFNGRLTVAADFHPVWSWPLKWRGAINPKLGPGQPSLIFVGDMSDLFHEGRPIAQIDRVIIAGLRSPHILQLLTKRPDVMANYIANLSFARAVWNCRKSPDEPLPMIGRHSFNDLERLFGLKPRFSYDRDCAAWLGRRLWLGFSAERQKEFDERWPAMRPLADAGWTIFVSHEPALGPITYPRDFLTLGKRAQVIAGGMSGNDATPALASWFRHDRDQCACAGVPFFFKQWGKWLDADQLLTRIEAGPSFIVKDGERWQPTRPLNYADAAFLADTLGHPYEHHSDGSTMLCLDKRRAGRLLDGVEHNGFPEVKAA